MRGWVRSRRKNYLQAVNQAAAEDGKLDLDPQAFDAVVGSFLPGSGTAGTTKRIVGKVANG
jgi:hypothetical protein